MQFRHKLQRSFWKRVNWLRFGKRYYLTEYFGARFLVRNTNAIGVHIAAGVCDIYQLQALIAACERRKPAVFLDIGANSGLYSCILLRQNLVPRAVAFEPDRRNAAHLEANILLNDLVEQVDLRTSAAGREPGRLRLIPAPEANTGTSHLATARESEPGYEVDVVRLDDALALKGITLAAKIDVEGHEMEALDGMARTLADNRGVLQIETWDKRDAVIATLTSHGWMLVGEEVPDLFFEKR